VIFSRSGRGSGGRHAADDRKAGSGDDHKARSGQADERDDERDGADAPPAFGPYDVSEAPDGDFFDLGSLKIPTVEGVDVRVQANNEGVVQQVVLIAGESVLELAAFAAPRGEGIWDDARAAIRESLSREGAAVEEISGDYGRELRARVRAEQGPTDIRFVGVDGPRWMVRAVYHGRAAREPEAAGLLGTCLRGLVVDRGRNAMPAEEALPLRLPREMADAARAQMAAEAADRDDQPADRSDQQGRSSPRPRRPD
jgi:hypothetical protein